MTDEHSLSGQVKFAAINENGAADKEIVAAVTGRKITVVSMVLNANAASAVRFESGAGGAALTGVMNLTAASNLVLPYNPAGWFETVAAQALSMELAGGSSEVDGCLSYIET
jgi:hypothetical protein